MKHITFFLYSLFFLHFAQAQTGLTVGPPRLYFTANSGQNQSELLEVTNPSKDYTLELSVSFQDWEYSEYGDNVLAQAGTLSNSCAEWISVSEPFFMLNPGETKQLTVNLQVPSAFVYTDATPVHTAMLFVTQLNPKEGQDRDGANIRVAVRSGVKVYHRFPDRNNPDLEIQNLRYLPQDSTSSFLEASFEATGNVWLEGEITVELLNQDSGDKIRLEKQNFFCLPHDKRKHYIALPKDLQAGEYLASVVMSYGDNNRIKIGELIFKHVND